MHIFQFLRSLLFTTGQVLATIFIASIGLILFPAPYLIRYRFITSWSHFIIAWAKITCGISYQIRGLEHLPAKNAVVLCKHQSTWETLFLQVLLGPQCWVLKRELLSIPFFGWALSLLEPIAIDRSKQSAIKQLLKQGQQRLKQGRWVIIFPEGSRMAVGETGRYSRSGAILAKETGFPIVPIAHNAGVFWPKNGFLKRPGIVSVIIGPLIEPTHLSADEIQEKAKQWIEETMRTLPTT